MFCAIFNFQTRSNADIIEMRVKSETFLTVSLGSFHVMSFYFRIIL